MMAPASALTSLCRGPRIESYFNRWARVLVSVRSFVPTISTSGLSIAARTTFRPILPNPLIPTLIAIKNSQDSNQPDVLVTAGQTIEQAELRERIGDAPGDSVVGIVHRSFDQGLFGPTLFALKPLGQLFFGLFLALLFFLALLECLRTTSCHCRS